MLARLLLTVGAACSAKLPHADALLLVLDGDVDRPTQLLGDLPGRPLELGGVAISPMPDGLLLNVLSPRRDGPGRLRVGVALDGDANKGCRNGMVTSNRNGMPLLSTGRTSASPLN